MPSRGPFRPEIEQLESRDMPSPLGVTAPGSLPAPLLTPPQSGGLSVQPSNTILTQSAANAGTAAAAVPAVPAAPSGLAATAVSPSEINLTWDLGDAADTTVVIERRTGVGGTYQTLATLPGGENTFTDTSCWASTTYFYRVKARDAAGDSGYSPQQSATTQAVPAGALAVVTSLRAVATSPTTATVSFTDPNTAVAQRGYLLQRSSDGVSYQTVA